MNQHGNHSQGNQHYLLLMVMTFASFISMYVLMYSMVDKFTNIYTNINQFYMAGLMTVPMIVIELTIMGTMYKNKKINAVIILASIIIGLGLFTGIRQQSFVGDRQFLRSMISHHASAILMCENAQIEEPEIQELCQNIIAGQQKEIDQMKSLLE